MRKMLKQKTGGFGKSTKSAPGPLSPAKQKNQLFLDSPNPFETVESIRGYLFYQVPKSDPKISQK